MEHHGAIGIPRGMIRSGSRRKTGFGPLDRGSKAAAVRPPDRTRSGKTKQNMVTLFSQDTIGVGGSHPSGGFRLRRNDSNGDIAQSLKSHLKVRYEAFYNIVYIVKSRTGMAPYRTPPFPSPCVEVGDVSRPLCFAFPCGKPATGGHSCSAFYYDLSPYPLSKGGNY